MLIGSPPPSASAETAGTTLWEARWQHVRLVPRDGGGANGHPVNLAKADIRNGLAQLRLDSGNGEPVEMLTADERAFVAEQLSKALAKAGPDQDVSIATIGMRKTILGLNEPRLTTLRAFMGTDGLNLIVGEALSEPPNDTGTYQKVDPRLVSFQEGRRSAPAKAEARWKILAADKSAVTLRRSDWAAIPATAMAVPEPGSEEAQKQAQGQMEQMQQQMRQMQQQMQQPQKPAAAPAAPPAAPPPAVEDRLRTLDQLKAKGLISQKEYAAKRRQIIDSF
ncbi:hypothetical protein H261_12964 [Paramagnetospirillum caucaseum]|uniref:SHOCT domain-containing protein n=1 Tax=Paramagnetospirillum caucaseum TaxID=1244869 RepID=M2Z578_9PROT|nr:SHOCT domain-containing protein [Paramagnetospirillum caucaseum]EME69475.1 hypothetical protein H261_12964 [Paramagnetospirillum caucaseum]